MSFTRDNFHRAGQLGDQDPDGVLRYFLDIIQGCFIDGLPKVVNGIDPSDVLSQEFVSYSKDVRSLYDLLDPDKAPAVPHPTNNTVDPNYLPYLSRLIGYDQPFEDAVVSGVDIPKKRYQIKNVVNWYAVKGSPASFKITFDLGPDINVTLLQGWLEIATNQVDYFPAGTTPVPMNPQDPVARANMFDSLGRPLWVPNSTLQLVLDVSGNMITISSEEFEEIIRRIDEVKPRHLIFDVILSLIWSGDCPGSGTIDKSTAKCADELYIKEGLFYFDVTLGDPTLTDVFNFTPQGLTHGNGCYPAVIHDGVAIGQHSRDGSQNLPAFDEFEQRIFTHDNAQPQSRGTCLLHNYSTGAIKHDNDNRFDILEIYADVGSGYYLVAES